MRSVLLFSAAATTWNAQINFLTAAALQVYSYCVQNPIPFWFRAHTMRNLSRTPAKTINIQARSTPESHPF